MKAKPLTPDQLQQLGMYYQSGLLTNELLADKFGVSERFIRNQASKHNWIKARLKAKIDEEYTNETLRQAINENLKELPKVRDTDTLAQAAAKMQAALTARHRQRITSYSSTADDLADNLAGRVAKMADVDALISSMTDSQIAAADKQLVESLRQVFQFDNVISQLDRLTSITERLIKLERALYGLSPLAQNEKSNDSGVGGLPQSAMSSHIARVVMDINSRRMKDGEANLKNDEFSAGSEITINVKPLFPLSFKDIDDVIDIDVNNQDN